MMQGLSTEFDVISYAEELQRYISMKMSGNHIDPNHSHDHLRYKQLLLETQYHLAEIQQLNQPRLHIPARFSRFPFSMIKPFFKLFLKIFNYLNGPQRAINAHLQQIVLINISAIEQLLEQQHQDDFQQEKEIDTIKQHLQELFEKIS